MTEKIKILVVDDSAFMRIALEKMLREEPDFHVVASASNGQDGVEKVVRLKPDVVTMDIEMPVMDGLHALKEIMRLCPTPVLMVSSMTQNGAQVTFDALDLGAVDYVSKPSAKLSLSIFDLKDNLIKKVRAAAKGLPRVIGHRLYDFGKRRPPVPFSQNTEIEKIVAIGSSTGGPPAIRLILGQLQSNLPAPVLIAQHMPSVFTKAFAQRLNGLCDIRVKEAVDGEVLQRSIAYVCPGDCQTRISKTSEGKFIFSITKNSDENLKFAPCIDVIFESVAEHFGPHAIGVILTGMGNNGVAGLGKIKERGGFTVAQDKETSVVYGMPRAAVDQDAAARILPINEISGEIEIFLK